MTQAFIGLGSNIGPSARTLAQTIGQLEQLSPLSPLQSSSLYCSTPLGCPGLQPNYLNAVVKIDTTLNPYFLLFLLQKLEQRAGRQRTQNNAARTLDLDLLSYGQVIQKNSILTLPHPRLTERAFVLIPLLEIDPDCRLPAHGYLRKYLNQCLHQPIRRL